MLLDLHRDFLGGRSGGLIFPSLEELSTVCCDPHKGFSIVNEAELDVFLESLVDSKLLDKDFLNKQKLKEFITTRLTLQEKSRKTSSFVSLTMLKPLCGSQQTVENS